MWAIKAIIIAVSVFLGVYGYSAQKSWEREQERATQIESARREKVLEETQAKAEARARELEALNEKLRKDVDNAVTFSRSVKDRACLDAGSVRALDAVRRAPRR